MTILIRPYGEQDMPRLKQITVDAFDGVSIDQAIERETGPINGRDWRWRKARAVEDDAAHDGSAIFVAERNGTVIGYLSTWLDRAAGIGHIPNMSLVPEERGQGLGRRLIEHALEHFRSQGLSCARIETLEQNPVGQHLYPALGFREAARQIHYFMKL